MNKEEIISTEDTSIKEETVDSLKAEIEELKQTQSKIQLEQLKKERDALLAEVKQYRYPEQDKIENPEPNQEDIMLEKIENKYKHLQMAKEIYPIGHPERQGFRYTDTFNGKPLWQGYMEYTRDKKPIKEIFINPYKINSIKITNIE